MSSKIAICEWNKLEDRSPIHVLVKNTDLVVIRYGDNVSVLYGRCDHRGALLGDGYIDGRNLICGVHQWDYRYDTGISEYNPAEHLYRFKASLDGGKVWVDEAEIDAYEREQLVAVNREDYLGAYEATHPIPEEPNAATIQYLSKHGLSKLGHHGPMDAMGVGGHLLPKWDDISSTRPVSETASP